MIVCALNANASTPNWPIQLTIDSNSSYIPKKSTLTCRYAVFVNGATETSAQTNVGIGTQTAYVFNYERTERVKAKHTNELTCQVKNGGLGLPIVYGLDSFNCHDFPAGQTLSIDKAVDSGQCEMIYYK